MRRRLVEDQDRRVLEERPRDGHALALAARELQATLAHHGVGALRQRLDQVTERRAVERRTQLGVGRGRAREQHVGAERVVEEVRVLSDERDLTPEIVELPRPHVVTGQPDLARVAIPEAQAEMRDRRLARARGADECDGAAAGHAE